MRVSRLPPWEGGPSQSPAISLSWGDGAGRVGRVVWGFKLRSNIMCCLYIWALNGITTSYPPNSAPVDELPSQQPSLSGGSKVLVYPWVVGFSSLTARGIIKQANHSPLQEAGDHHTLLILTLIASGYSLCSRVPPPCGPVQRAVPSSPRLWVYVTKVHLICPVGQHVSGYSHNSRAEDPLSSIG